MWLSLKGQVKEMGTGQAHINNNQRPYLWGRGSESEISAMFVHHVFQIDPLLLCAYTCCKHKTAPRAVHVLRETSGENLIAQWLLWRQKFEKLRDDVMARLSDLSKQMQRKDGRILPLFLSMARLW